jgi:predicted nucleotidyltransferase
MVWGWIMNNIYINEATVLDVIRERQPEIADRFTVRRIGVFGSFARGTAGPESDVDILVEFHEPTFDNYMDLKFYLEDILNHQVDLVIHDAVKPRLKRIIEQEVEYA